MGCYKVSAPNLRLVNILINRFSKNEKKTMLHLLPHHIFEDILLRLPLKTIFQCMCVSKLWYSVIKDPLFTNQLDLKQQHNHILVFSCGTDVYSLDYEASIPKVVEIVHSSDITKEPYGPLELVLGVRIWGSSKGFLCITSVGSGTAFLWNPYTREYKKIPNTPKHPCDDIYWRRCRFMYMVGYDAATQDYIVVCVFNYMNSGSWNCYPCFDSHSEVDVYSSRKNSWRRIHDIPYVIEHLARGRFINGSFYWVAQQNSRLVILNYHVETEKVVEVVLPDYVDRAYNDITVASLDGYLCAVFHYGDYYHNDVRHESEGWILKSCDVSISWTKLFCIPDYNIVPLSFIKNGAELLLVNDRRGLYVYEVGSKRIREFKIQNCRREYIEAAIYTESVVPLCS